MYKIDNFEWNKSGTNIIIKDITNDEAKIVQELFDIQDDDRFDDGDFSIFSNDIKRVFLLEEDYIETKKRNLKDILDKFNEKEFKSPFYYYSSESGRLIKIKEFYNFEDYDFLDDLLSNNIINAQEHSNKDFYLSPKIFESIKLMYNKYDNREKNKKSNNILTYLRELFSLLVIAEKTEINKNRTNKIIFEFTLYNDLHGNIIKEIEWAKWEVLANANFFSLYEWITDEIDEDLSSSEINYNLKQAKLRANLVRNYLKGKKDFKINANSIGELNSIINRVHKNETEEYFKQQNKLKDEMIELSKDEMASKRNITNRILGLITTVSVAIFTQFFETDISNLEELLAPNFTISVIFAFAFIAIFFVSYFLYLDIHERIDYYEKLKHIYVTDLSFNSEDFEEKIKKPEMWYDYKTYWIILLIAIIMTLLGIKCFSPDKLNKFYLSINFIEFFKTSFSL